MLVEMKYVVMVIYFVDTVLLYGNNMYRSCNLNTGWT